MYITVEMNNGTFIKGGEEIKSGLVSMKIIQRIRVISPSTHPCPALTGDLTVQFPDFPDYPPSMFDFIADDQPPDRTIATVKATSVKVFYVVGSGFGNFNNETDPKGYNLIDPPKFTTVSLPKKGWVAIRFKASNPGVWLWHCHLDRHFGWGMNTVIIVKDGGTPETSIRRPPAFLPPCNGSPAMMLEEFYHNHTTRKTNDGHGERREGFHLRDPPSSANCLYIFRPEVPSQEGLTRRGERLPFWGCFAARVILASGLLPALHSLDTREGLTMAILPGMIFGDREIYNLGGRKIAFQNVGPLGCVPATKAMNPALGSKCSEEPLTLARLHNRVLFSNFKKLEKSVSGFKFSIFDYYNALGDRINDPSKYGFKDGKAACCGSGAYRGSNCGGGKNGTAYELCSNPNECVV
ncbi:hypothetical protein ACLB2K_066994 [Fragaria x ananassa]